MINPERAVHCANCRAAIAPGEVIYTVRVDLFVEARAPEFDDEDLIEDTSGEWERLLSQMEEMSDEEIESESAKVHERHEFRLCGRCRNDFHEKLRAFGS